MRADLNTRRSQALRLLSDGIQRDLEAPAVRTLYAHNRPDGADGAEEVRRRRLLDALG